MKIFLVLVVLLFSTVSATRGEKLHQQEVNRVMFSFALFLSAIKTFDAPISIPEALVFSLYYFIVRPLVLLSLFQTV